MSEQESDSGPVYDEACPNDPVGEGLHFFKTGNRCIYCNATDPLRPESDSGPLLSDDRIQAIAYRINQAVILNPTQMDRVVAILRDELGDPTNA